MSRTTPQVSTVLRSALFAITVLVAGCAGAQVATRQEPVVPPDALAVFGDQTLTVSEFERRYARAVGGPEQAADDSLGAYRDFLDRYVDFRLKVLDARSRGLHRDSALLAELSQYRLQLARPYLLEKAVLDSLVQDLHRKQQVRVDVSHLLVAVPQNAPPADTLAAYRKIAGYRAQILAGEAFDEMAARHSEDPSAAQNRGRLGFISGGQTVQPFEDVAWATPVDSVSQILRTQFGYHLLKIHERRPAESDVRIAHIMLVPPSRTTEDSLAAVARLRELRQRVLAGEDFAALARQYSQDSRSSDQGGELGLFSRGTLPPRFEEAAFALDSAGAVSDVVTSDFGLHLIKLLERKAPETLEEAYPKLKEQVMRMPQRYAAERRLGLRIRAERGSRVDSALARAAVAQYRPDSLFSKIQQQGFGPQFDDRTIGTVGDSAFTFRDYAAFLRGLRLPAFTSPPDAFFRILDDYLSHRAIDVAAAALEESDPAFADLMAEYHDGILLFKVSEDSVWNAAATDSVGLRAYYDANRDRFRFPDRRRVIGFTSPSDSTLRQVAALLDRQQPIDQILARFDSGSAALQVDTMLVADSTRSVYDRALSLQPGQRTEPLRDRRGFVLLHHAGVEPSRPKSFEEARPEVVNEYQKQLEAAWLARLRDRYDLRLFPERLDQVFDGPAVGEQGSQTGAGSAGTASKR